MPLSSRNNGNHTASIEIPYFGYINYVPSKNIIFGQTRNRVGSYVQRNASNLGVHGKGHLTHRSIIGRLDSVDSL